MHAPAATLSSFDAAAIVIVAAAILGYINHRFFKLPHVIGLTIMGALAAIALIAANAIIPGLTLDNQVAAFLDNLDFRGR